MKIRQLISLAAGVGRALRRAAKDAHKTARMYGTPLYVWENGKVLAKKPQKHAPGSQRSRLDAMAFIATSRRVVEPRKWRDWRAIPAGKLAPMLRSVRRSRVPSSGS